MEAKAITVSFYKHRFNNTPKEGDSRKRGGLIEYDKRNGICKMYGSIKPANKKSRLD